MYSRNSTILGNDLNIHSNRMEQQHQSTFMGQQCQYKFKTANGDVSVPATGGNTTRVKLGHLLFIRVKAEARHLADLRGVLLPAVLLPLVLPSLLHLPPLGTGSSRLTHCIFKK